MLNTSLANLDLKAAMEWRMLVRANKVQSTCMAS